MSGPALMDRKEPWHIRKEVTVGNMITTITVIAGIAFYVVDIDKRVTRIEAQREETVRRLASIEAEIKDVAKEIRTYLLRRSDGRAPFPK